MKRLIICILSLLLCLGIFAGCKKSDEEIPKGFQNATCAGDAFRFYIPSTWNSTVDYGIAGGYYNLSTTSVVRMKEYPRTDDLSADAFYESALRPAMTALARDLQEKEEPASALLGKLEAGRYSEAGTVSGKKMRFVSYVGLSKEAFYVLTFTCDESAYDTLLPDVKSMAEVFLVASPYQSASVRKPNGKVDAPAGMKLASTDDVSYRFFIPEEWDFDENISISEGHNKAGNANLSVTPYLPSDSMTTEEFLAKQNEELSIAYGIGLEKLGESEATLGDREAKVAEYRIKSDGSIYRVRVTVTAYKGMFYSLTYTATEEAYSLYLADAAQAVSAFTFR